MLLNDHRQHLPPQTLALGMCLFLAALVMLFGASMIGYIQVRLDNADVLGLGQLKPPTLLWASTAMILISSITIHLAVESVASEKQLRFRGALLATLLLSLGFVVVQTPALTTLLRNHHRAMEHNTFLFGLVFFLILVHALHVIGGLIPMVIITVKAHLGGYDHESHAPVKCLGYYWHFLDGVWVVMFSLFMALR